MSAIAQDVFLNSPLSDAFVVEAFYACSKLKKKRKNKRVCSYYKEYEALNDIAPVGSQWSSFTQALCGQMFEQELQFPSGHSHSDEMEEILEKSIYALNIQKKIHSRKTGGNYQPVSLNQLKSLESWKFVQVYYNLRCQVEWIVRATAKPLGAPEWVNVPPEVQVVSSNGIKFYQTHVAGRYEVTLGRSMVHIKDLASGNIYLSSREHFLLLSDLFSQRFICLLASASSEVIKESILPDIDTLLRVFRWGDDILAASGNKGYGLLKMWEPLLIGYILKSNASYDEFVDPKTFWDLMQADFRKEEIEVFPDYAKSEELREILRKASRNIDWLTQLHGLYRIWGHPTVDGIAGVIALTKITRQPRMMNTPAIILMNSKWREYFCQGYYRRNRKWPKIKPTDATNYIVRSIISGAPISRRNPDYHSRDWLSFEFDETFSVPTRFNISEIIADKATSLMKHELIREVLESDSIGSDRSVIVRWLKTNINNPVAFLRGISENGFAEGTTVAGVHPKEREMKIHARLFGLMTLEKRLYIVITEAMIADFLLPCFPEITMTYAQSTLQHRLHQSNKPLANNGTESKVTIVTNLDFEKWNSYMREQETIGMFSDFDDLFGIPQLFARTHELFKTSTFYLADGTIELKVKNENGELELEDQLGVWRDHLGGIEGLRQKGWTIFTVVLLKYISEASGVETQILGQGDNQVLLSTFPNLGPEEVRKMHAKFLDNLTSFLSLIGPPLKRDESWASSSFFAYSKEPIHRGVPRSNSIKKLSRCFRMNNEGVMSVEATVGAIAANSAAAARSSHTPWIPYLIGKFETIGALYLNIRWPMYHAESLFPKLDHFNLSYPVEKKIKRFKMNVPFLYPQVRDEWIHLSFLLSWIPASLGGFPSVTMLDLMIHGFPDPVVAAIVELKRVHSASSNAVLKHVIACILTPRFSEEISPLLLLENPTSLNLAVCSRPGDRLRNKVFECLTSWTWIQNDAFKVMLSKAVENQKPLAEELFKARPLRPRVGNSILDSTVVGQANAAIRKIDKTNILLRMVDTNLLIRELQEMGEEDVEEFGRTRNLFKCVQQYDLDFFNSVLSIISSKTPNLDNLTTCSVVLASRWRSQSWGVEDEIEGVTVAHPEELLGIPEDTRLCSHDPDPSGYLFQRFVQPKMGDRYCFDTMGPFKPFFGSITKEKISYQGSDAVRVAPPLLRNALSSLRLINWEKGGIMDGGNMAELLKRIVASITDLDIQGMYPEVGQGTGTVDHRFCDARTSHSTTPALSYTPSTHFAVITNQFKPETIPEGEHDNVNISFQACFSYLASLNNIRLSHRNVISESTHIHLDCKDCVRAINEEPSEINQINWEKIESILRPDPTNHLVFIQEDEIVQKLRQKIQEREIRSNPDPGRWSSLIKLSIMEWSIQNCHWESQGTDSWQAKEDQNMFPINVALKMDFGLIIKSIALSFFLHHMWIWSGLFSSGSLASFNELVNHASLSLSQMRSSWLFPFESIYMAKGKRRFFQQYPMLSAPRGIPPTKNEIASSLHKTLIHLIQKITPKVITSAAESVFRNGTIMSKSLILNPTFWGCVHHIANDWTLSTAYFQAIRGLRGISSYREEIEIGSATNLAELIEGGDDNNVRATLMLTEGAHDTVVWQVSLDWLATHISPRIRYDEERDQGKTLTLTLEDLKDCGDHGRILEVPPLQSNIYEGHLQPTLLSFPPSECNTQFKFPWTGTAAVNKILGILCFLMEMGLNPIKVLRAAAVGDGVGGFTVALTSVFPNAKVLYNSLFEPENQSPTGSIEIWPSAFNSPLARVSDILGLRNVTEKISDLLNPGIISQFLEELGGLCDGVVCDAEGGGWDSPQKSIIITTHLCELLSGSSRSPQFIVKKSYSSRPDMVLGECALIANIFKRVFIYRSDSSGCGNTEVYLIGMDGKPPHERGTTAIWVEANHVIVKGPWFSERWVRGVLSALSSKPFYYCYEPIFPDQLTRLFRSKGWQPPLFHSEFTKMMKEEESLGFPRTVLKVLRYEYPLLRFSDKNRSSSRKSILDVSTVSEILAKFLASAIVSCGGSCFTKFESSIHKFCGVIYQSISGGWAVNWIPITWRNIKTHFPNAKIIPGTHLHENKSFWRLVGILVRELSNELVEETDLLAGCNPPQVLGFEFHNKPGKIWYKKAGLGLFPAGKNVAWVPPLESEGREYEEDHNGQWNPLGYKELEVPGDILLKQKGRKQYNPKIKILDTQVVRSSLHVRGLLEKFRREYEYQEDDYE